MLMEEGHRDRGEEQSGGEGPDEEGLVDMLFFGTDHRSSRAHWSHITSKRVSFSWTRPSLPQLY